MSGPRWLEKDFNPKLKRWGKVHLGGHDVVRRVDPDGEALVWCRKRTCHARCRLGPKLMGRCRPEKKDTKEDWDNVEKNLQTWRRRCAGQKRERIESRGRKKKSHREKGCRRRGTKRFVGHCQEEDVRRQRSVTPSGGTDQRIPGHARG